MVYDSKCFERMPWLSLYRVWGQGAYIGGDSLDRRVVSQRDVLTNLAYKLRRLEVHVRTWLSSWSCGHVAAWCLLCWSWWHCRHGDDAPTSYATWSPLWSSSSSPSFLGRRTGVSGHPQVDYRLVVRRSGRPRSLPLQSWFPPVWRASKSRPSSWIPSHSG
jgi:hypothetical protein